MESTSNSTRKIDNGLQGKLYTNIALLMKKHEPSAEFIKVFKKDMFAKSNKAAFLHVMHYLLTILNPELAKKKLVTWPTGNIIKRENKFRNEVLQYLNELNHLYEEADLPKMMSSHLLAPGGHRFIYFMYKLSQLVLVEDLKREDSFEILNRPKPSKNNGLNEKAYNAKITSTKEINFETLGMMAESDNSFEMFKKAAEKIEKDKHEVHQEMKELDSKIELEEIKFRLHKLTAEDLSEKLKEIEKKVQVIEKIVKFFSECTNFINHVKEHADGNRVLDLEESVKTLNIKMKRALADLPVYEISELETHLQKVEEKRDEINEVGKKTQITQVAFEEAIKRSEKTFRQICKDLGEY